MKTELVIARYNEDLSWTTTINDPDVYCTIYNKGKPIDLPCIPLPNIGRESHTYLQHIINNYNNLADITIFCQGDSIFHSPKFMDLIKYRDQFEGIQPLAAYYWPEGEPPFMLSNPPKIVLNKTQDLWIKDCPIHVEYVDSEFRTRWPNTYYQSHFIQLVNEMKRIYKTDNLMETFIDEFKLKNVNKTELVPISYAGLFAVRRDVIHQHPKLFYERIMHTLIEKKMQYTDGRDIDFGLFLEKMWLVIFNYKINNKHYKKLLESNFHIREVELTVEKNTVLFDIYSVFHQIFLELVIDRTPIEIQLSGGKSMIRDNKKKKYANYTYERQFKQLQVFKDDTTINVKIKLNNNILTVFVNNSYFFNAKFTTKMNKIRYAKLHYLSDDNLVKDMFLKIEPSHTVPSPINPLIMDSPLTNGDPVNYIMPIPQLENILTRISSNTTKYAYVIVHFGSGISYIELELYFIMQLRKYTEYDIIYMYSSNDTPVDFVNAISPFATKVIEFEDVIKSIDQFNEMDKKYLSQRYTAFRTCNYVHGYALVDYEKVCIIESDLVLMNSIDGIFELNAPATLCYDTPISKINTNILASNDPENTLKTCNSKSTGNGGIFLIQPNIDKYNQVLNDVQMIVKSKCLYPNEALFQYSENKYYNLPIKYNLSHYHIKLLSKYGVNPKDILIFHFNETPYKHLDIIKENWNDLQTLNEKTLPVIHFKNTVYEPFKDTVNKVLKNVSNKYVALLCLTSENMQFQDIYKEYFKKCNVYIHPKFKDKVDTDNRQYIIENNVETKWNHVSIVHAMVELLKASFINPANKYFMLLSQDACPLYSADKLFAFLNMECDLSIFSHSSKLNTVKMRVNGKDAEKPIYRASQWWCLTREDVRKILAKYDDFKIYNLKTNAAPDEFYLFTLLKHCYPSYKYHEKIFMYTDWFDEIKMKKHPAIHNKLLYSDLLKMKENNSMFIRKTFPTFQRETYFPSHVLFTAIIGTNTRQKQLLEDLNAPTIKDMDVILISMIPYNDIIPELSERCVKAHHIYWKSLNEYILLFTKKYRAVYSSIYFIDETARIDENIFKTNIMSTLTNLKIKDKTVFFDNFNINEIANYTYTQLTYKAQNILAYLNNTYRIADYPPVIRRPLKFIHITKCGGTSIEDLGQKYNLNWGIYDMEIKEACSQICDLRCSYWHVPPRYYNKAAYMRMKEKYDFFALVRNPYDRVVSEYYYRVSGPKIKATTAEEFNKWITTKLLCVEKDVNEKLKTGKVLEGHWIPAYLYITPNVTVIKLENVKEELSGFLSKYNMNVINQLGIENVGIKRFGVSDLSSLNKNLINRIYSLDFDKLDYVKMDISMPSSVTSKNNQNKPPVKQKIKTKRNVRRSPK